MELVVSSKTTSLFQAHTEFDGPTLDFMEKQTEHQQMMIYRGVPSDRLNNIFPVRIRRARRMLSVTHGVKGNVSMNKLRPVVFVVRLGSGDEDIEEGRTTLHAKDSQDVTLSLDPVSFARVLLFGD